MEQQKKHFQKLNMANKDSNRGSALLSIIIVVAVVSVLAMLALSMSYNSFRMKNVDKKSSDNFYGAEKVLDEVCARLEQEISVQSVNAYTKVMTNYGAYASAEDMQNDYREAFINGMLTVLEDDLKPGFYEVSVLNGYVNAVNYEGAVYQVLSEDSKRIVDEVNNGICIRNLSVTYEKDGYYNKITTDIRLTMPEVSFAKISNVPAVTDYALIAGGGVELSNNTAYEIEGKIYAGNSIMLNAGSKLKTANTETTKAPTLVSEGDIQVVGASELSVDEHTALWANSVTADKSAVNADTASNKVSLLGKTYIKDDVTLNGRENSLTLGGEYYGYSGSDAAASESSAIIINGAYTTLDMSALDTLVLSGTAFVGTKGEAYEKLQQTDPSLGNDKNTEDILMGESVAVKANQLIYMVSTECEGIDSNPMSYAQYQKLITDSNWENKALSTQLAGIGRSVSSYGSVKITPVFTNKTGGAVYLYLDFESSEAAARYFMDSYGNSAAGQKVQSYLSTYVKTFKFHNEDMNRIVTQGNYLVPIDETTPTYHASVGDIADFNLQGTFTELCNQAKFDTLISEEGLDLLMNTVSDVDDTDNNTSVTVTTVNGAKTVTFSGGSVPNKIQAVIVDNEGKSAFNIESAFNGFKGILIATGDVNINGTASQMDGLIICKGKLTVVTGDVKLAYNPEYVSSALRIVCSQVDEADETNSKSYAVLSVFKGYEGVGTVSGTSDGTAEIRKCISFENWKSE